MDQKTEFISLTALVTMNAHCSMQTMIRQNQNLVLVVRVVVTDVMQLILNSAWFAAPISSSTSRSQVMESAKDLALMA